MLPWSVKIERSEHGELAERLHKVLNRRGPCDLSEAAELVRREAGLGYVVARSGGGISLHAALRGEGSRSSPPVIRITPSGQRANEAPGKRARWGKEHRKCPECKRAHTLSFDGEYPPMIYGYLCPRTGQAVIFRVDREGWTKYKMGDVRSFAIALPRSDRMAATAL